MNFDFSFNETAGASQSTFRTPLAANEIHEVQFDGVEPAEFKSKDDPDKSYKVLRLNFSNEKGSFTHTIWAPTAQDGVRTSRETMDKNGNPITITDPSRWETSRLLIKHLIDAVNPEYGAKIDNQEVHFGGKNWEELCKNVGLVCNPKTPQSKVTTHIKLISNKDGEAIFPGFFVGIRREDGKSYIRNNFIGKGLSFNSYEADRIKNMKTSKPTTMPDIPTIEESDDLGDLNTEFDVINLI